MKLQILIAAMIAAAVAAEISPGVATVSINPAQVKGLPTEAFDIIWSNVIAAAFVAAGMVIWSYRSVLVGILVGVLLPVTIMIMIPSLTLNFEWIKPSYFISVALCGLVGAAPIILYRESRKHENL